MNSQNDQFPVDRGTGGDGVEGYMGGDEKVQRIFSKIKFATILKKGKFINHFDACCSFTKVPLAMIYSIKFTGGKIHCSCNFHCHCTVLHLNPS